jgi:hypothetical protein
VVGDKLLAGGDPKGSGGNPLALFLDSDIHRLAPAGQMVGVTLRVHEFRPRHIAEGLPASLTLVPEAHDKRPVIVTNMPQRVKHTQAVRDDMTDPILTAAVKNRRTS